MMLSEEEKYVFLAEWFQEEGLLHKFIMVFYPDDNSLELLRDDDPVRENKQQFLRRVKTNFNLSDMFVGARIFVYGRKIHITNYGNEETKQKIVPFTERTLILFPYTAKDKIDEIFSSITSLNLCTSNCFMLQCCSDDLVHLDDLDGRQHTSILLDKPSIAFELTGKNVTQKLKDIREAFGIVFSLNKDNIEIFIKNKINQVLPKSSSQKATALCLIKPHAFQGGNTGQILAQLLKNKHLSIENIKLCHLDRGKCEEFYEIYDSVLPEFLQMSIHLASGPFLALEIAADNVFSTLRNLCGPLDPVIAQRVRPHTIRAQFGTSKVENAVHCTDLIDDVNSELKFFFQ